jgi:hypothetical protein
MDSPAVPGQPVGAPRQDQPVDQVGVVGGEQLGDRPAGGHPDQVRGGAKLALDGLGVVVGDVAQAGGRV